MDQDIVDEIAALSTAKCLAVYKGAELVGYVTREWHYGTYPNGRWDRWKSGYSGWKLGIERSLRCGYTLIPCDEDDAMRRAGIWTPEVVQRFLRQINNPLEECE